ncbi:MAG: hypothetical protein ACRDGO_07220 [Actinomycetota bacterium]
MSTCTSRRRLQVAGLVAGLAIGAAVGAASLTGASSEGPPGAPPVVLHVARVLADPGADLELSAGLACPGAASGCEVASAVLHVLSRGSSGWTDVRGTLDAPGVRFVVPGSAVAEDGLSYWMEFAIEGGTRVVFPEGGATSAFRVLTTAGLRDVAWPGAFDLVTVVPSDGVVARLPYGNGTGEVGRVGGVGDEQPLGPSSFDVAPDGSIRVADWVHGRMLVLTAGGEPRGAVPLPIKRPVDVAVGSRGELAVTTLGLGATAFELDTDGSVIGRYGVETGVAERIAITPGGPHVWVGPAQWAPVRSRPGLALPAEAQSRGLASALPGRDGAVAFSQDLSGSRVAFVWARPDGSRSGAVLRLPAGVQPGVDHFVRGLPDGGAIAARGLWSEQGEAVALLRFAADGSIVTAELIAPPTREMDAAASTVRFRAPDEVLAVYAGDRGIRIERFEVKGR